MSDDLQLEDNGLAGRGHRVEEANVAQQNNVVFSEVPAGKEKSSERKFEEELKPSIDFFGRNLDDHSKIDDNNLRDSNSNSNDDENDFFSNDFANAGR